MPSYTSRSVLFSATLYRLCPAALDLAQDARPMNPCTNGEAMSVVLLVSSVVPYYVRAVLNISDIPWVLRYLRKFFLEHRRAINQ